MRDFVTLQLNGETRNIRGVSPTRTLLEYLRETERLKGTKEGCAEGDCGSCTVVVGEAVNGDVKRLSHNVPQRDINSARWACIFRISRRIESVPNHFIFDRILPNYMVFYI